MSTLISSPGNAVVPLSAILDQLQGKLSTSEIDALLAAVLAGRTREVRPGDLITADLMNQILAQIENLQTRVAILEGTAGAPVLTGRVSAGDVAINSLLELTGSGFDPTPSRNTVLLDQVPVSSFLGGSGPSLLRLQVPDLFSGLPRLVKTTVLTGGQESNALYIRLIPREVSQGGHVSIFSRTLALGEITAGQTYTLSWLVDSQTTLPASYRFRLAFTQLQGASESQWRAAAVLSPAGEQQLVRGNPLTVSAQLTIPAGSSRAQVTLEVESTDGLFRRTSDPLLLETGSTAAVSDPRVIISLPDAIGPFDPQGNPNPVRNASINVDGSSLDGLQLRFGATGEVALDLFVTDADGVTGDYAYSVEIEDAGTAWDVLGVTPEGHDGLGPLSDRLVTIRFRNNETGAPSAVRYMVVRASHSLPSGSTDLVSFIRFPIQGYAS